MGAPEIAFGSILDGPGTLQGAILGRGEHAGESYIGEDDAGEAYAGETMPEKPIME